MNDIVLELNDNKGAFEIKDNGETLAEMTFVLKDEVMKVYHTEVSPRLAGQGVAKKLLASMVAYAREHSLQVVPLCEYVHAQFERHPDEYADIWKKN